MSVKVVKDRKGPCWEVGHKRAGYWESIYLTREELHDLYMEIDNQGLR